MIQPNSYVTLKGEAVSLSSLDNEERKLLTRLKRRAKTHPDWNDFENYWGCLLADFYDGRRAPREKSSQTGLFRIAQDLSSRLAVAAGIARPPDYRDELEELIRSRFKTRREFCRATGISEDMLSHVLARRKHLSMDTLTEALSRIGCTLRILPVETSSSHKQSAH